MILLIDNYDSFTWNLFQLLSALGAKVVVRRNDAVSAAEVSEMDPKGLIISPGPGNPGDAGISCELIRRFAGSIPMLGVCLGHQCMGDVFGARIVRAPELMHGKTSIIHHRGVGSLAGLPNPFEAVRYHSLCVDRGSITHELEITAETSTGIVMAIRHRDLPLEGVQFHPESILTAVGPQLMSNFLARCGELKAQDWLSTA